MAIGNYRFNRRSNKSVREQWGPTLGEERGEALRRMMDRGETPSSFGSVKAFEAARQREVQAERDRVGPMAYDQSQGKMIPSPRARRERLSAERDAAEKQRVAVSEKQDREWENLVVRPDGARSIEVGSGRAATLGDGTELYQEELPSGGLINARGKGVAANIKKANEERKASGDRALQFQERLAENRRNAALSRLTDSGYDWSASDSPELFNKDGSLNLDKAKRAADLASGKRVADTFASWDADKRLDQMAVRMERDARRELSDLRRSKRNRFGAAGARRGEVDEPMTAARMRELENMIATGEENRSGLNPGFWRTEAENDQRNRVAQVELARRSEERSRALVESQRKQAAAVRTRTEAVGRPLTEDEIKKLGYPAWDDEAAWQERMKTDPSAVEVYNMRPVNVSRAGKAMSRALSAVV